MSLIYSGKKLISGGTTKLSEMVNDVGFVTKTVDNLVNYYKKSETYTKDEVTDLMSNLERIQLKEVDALPSSGESNTIYLVKKSEGVYEQHLWTKNGKFISLGTTQLDLQDYVKTEDTALETEDKTIVGAINELQSGLEKTQSALKLIEF